MGRYIAKRLLLMVPVLFGVSLLVFSMIRLIPGDIVDLMIGAELYVGAEYRAELRAKYGLDQPIYVQYAKWVGEILQGNFGASLRNNEPVIGTILRRLPITVELAVLSVVLSAIVAIPLGVVSAVRRNSATDFVARLVAMIGLSIPNFWLAAMLLLVTSVVFRWQPSLRLVPFWEDPLTNLSQLLMPTVSLSLALMAIVMRMTRSSMLEVLRQDYIQTARAKGLPPRVILVRHALKNAFIPVITILGVQVGALLGGTVLIEVIFGLPGIGRLLIDAINTRDYPMLQGTVLFIAVVFVMVNLLVDLLYAYLDPRIRYS
ncbi:MAG TPA: ABC transporter permease [Chloroflexota bacterium]|nr:ABC transporter permease [Chloroflexota bacterium]